MSTIVYYSCLILVLSQSISPIQEWRFYKRPPPPGVVPKWGEFHIAACRGFMAFVTQSAAARRVLEWANGTHIPDETVYSTLQGNPHLRAPGAYIPPPSAGRRDSSDVHLQDDTHHQSPYFNRYKVWDLDLTRCHSGRWRHWVHNYWMKTIVQYVEVI